MSISVWEYMHCVRMSRCENGGVCGSSGSVY